MRVISLLDGLGSPAAGCPEEDAFVVEGALTPAKAGRIPKDAATVLVQDLLLDGNTVKFAGFAARIAS